MLGSDESKVGAGLRKRLVSLFDDDAQQNRTTQYFNGALSLLIVVNVGAVILESVEPIRAGHPTVFLAIEHIATAIFAVEYGLRVWTAGDLRVLRLLRFLRMLKLTRHSRIFALIWAVLRQEARAIGALVFILCLTV